jgi:List-Bact-rpt repeat protein
MKPIATVTTARRAAILIAGLLLLTPLTSQAQTAVLFGALSNFDILNDTGQVTYGFEIELDGISSVGGTYTGNRYGQPAIVPFAGGVYVRYMSPYDPATQRFITGTLVATNFTPTTGHQCLLGLPAYQSSGCEHFGVWTMQNPTAAIYRWLVADPANPGQLIALGTPASIPAPVYTIIPPAQPGNPPAVVAQIHAPKPPQPALQFGDAQWVKVSKTELPREVGLDELVPDDPVVPQDPAQVETAWKLLQHNPHNPESGGSVLNSQSSLSGSSHAVIRKYDFYKYTGAYNPIDHSAQCGGDGLCTAPLDGELGDYIGDQNAAANVGVPSITVAKVGSGTVTGANGKINCGGSCTTTVAMGTSVTLTAIPPSNGVFSGWSGACNGTQLNCTVTVNDATNVTATFTTIFTLSIGRGGSGSVTGNPNGVNGTLINCGSNCSAKFMQGATVTLSATPAAGLSFVNWTGACSGAVPTCNVTIQKDTQVQANFK